MGKMSKKILAGLLAVVLVLGGILLYNLQMNKSFITTFYSVTVDKPVEDLRIVLLSDLHLHEYGEDNADLVRKIQNLAPDLIAVAGDMNIDTDTDYHVVLDLMHQLVDIAPVYYAPGNHEWGGRYAGGSDALFDDIQATGVHWLNGSYEDVEFKGRKLRIGGFFEWPRAQLERENSRAVADAMNGETNELDDVCTILICHCPGGSGHLAGAVPVRPCAQRPRPRRAGAHRQSRPLVYQSGFSAQIHQRGQPDGGVAGGHQPRPRRFGAVPAHLQPAGTGGRGCELSGKD